MAIRNMPSVNKSSLSVATKQTLLTGWLGQQAPEFSKAVLLAGRLEHFSDGDSIYTFGERKGRLYGVVAGVARLHVTRNGSMQLGHVAGPGFWFGDVEFITDRPSIMTVTAAGETQLLVLKRDAFDRIVRTHTDAWLSLARLCACNVDLAAAAAEDLMIRDSTGRMIALLLRLSSNRHAYQAAAPIAVIPATQEELSLAANLSRSTGSAILAELGKSGWLATGYRGIQIIDAEALRNRLAERTRLIAGE
jgi:CRP-like cAMP-binding protein